MGKLCIRKNRKLSGTKMLAVLLAAVFLVTGCVGPQETSGSKEKAITVGISSDTGSMDPAGVIALTFLSYSVTALDELLTFDENGEIEYRAAQSYEVNEDQTEWIFHLRQDAKWSDGTPVHAEDFYHTMTRALNPASGNGYANYLFPIRNAEAIYNGEKEMDTLGVEMPDEYTLVFHLETPCVYFLDLLRLPVYLPSCEKYADSVESGWDKNPATSVANGPFYLDSYEPEQYFVLKKNDNYWNADAIALEQITYKFFSDQQSMAGAYETGEIDVATSLPAFVMETYKDKDDLLVTNNIATRYIYPNLNCEVLSDVRVRKAINLAINREELCKVVGADTSPTVNLIAKYMKNKETGQYFIDESDPPFEENVEQAKELLAEAGYPNGEGFPKLTYKYPSLETDSDAAQVIQEQLKKNLNIEIELQAQELQMNYADRRAGEFELCRMNWTADFADPNTYLSMLLSNSTYNCSGMNDGEYDALVRASDTETDPKKRAELMHKAERLAVGEQFYIIPLFSTQSVNLIRPGIEGITQIPATGALEYRLADVK